MVENIDLIKNELSIYKCHTMILYGSRATNKYNQYSDYDILALSDSITELTRDNRIIKSIFLDAWIYPSNMILNPDKNLVRIRNGKIICEQNGLGTTVLNLANKLFLGGPDKINKWEKIAKKNWAIRMLKRIEHHDVEGYFRLHWLLYELLENYFQVRDLWYLGPKKSFDWLASNDRNVFIQFSKTLKTPVVEQIKRLVEDVFSVSIVPND